VGKDGDLVLLSAGLVVAIFGYFLLQSSHLPDFDSDDVKGSTKKDVEGRLRHSYPNLHQLVSLRPDVERFLPVVRDAVKRHESTYKLDPLLVLALIEAESAFEIKRVSAVGAAGPMQFMPETGREMGLSPIYSPGVLKRAFEVDDRSRRLYSRAEALMRGEHYDRLPAVVTRWKRVNERASELFQQYRETLLEKIRDRSDAEVASIDQRFHLKESVFHGVKYLAKLFKERNGDLREALSAYNAGPNSVRRYEGIPPYDQTVNYQNKIVNTYRKYRRHLLSPEKVKQPKLTALP
jgi:hypothetical protein